MTHIQHSADEWKAGAVAFPKKIELSPEQLEVISSDLRSIGITDDVMAMDPPRRLEWLGRSRYNAQCVYAAILHATQGTHTLTQDFNSWARSLGLSWSQ